MENLRGRTAILTGASYGIGLYIARALAKEGANVALAARSEDKLKAVADELTALGVKAIPIPTDITDAASREALITQTEAELGPIDILVNNAGIYRASSFDDLRPEEIEQVIQTNLTSTLLLTRRVLPAMLERKSGHIVINSSLAGKVGMPYMATYSASKYALVGFNNSLQAELKGTGVRSTAICFGFISDDGMWARLERPVHPAFGTTSPERVATLIIRAIKGNWVERVINPIPVQPVLATWTLAPRLASWMFGLLRVDKFMEENAKAVKSAPSIMTE